MSIEIFGWTDVKCALFRVYKINFFFLLLLFFFNCTAHVQPIFEKGGLLQYQMQSKSMTFTPSTNTIRVFTSYCAVWYSFNLVDRHLIIKELELTYVYMTLSLYCLFRWTLLIFLTINHRSNIQDKIHVCVYSFTFRVLVGWVIVVIIIMTGLYLSKLSIC